MGVHRSSWNILRNANDHKSTSFSLLEYGRKPRFSIGCTSILLEHSNADDHESASFSLLTELPDFRVFCLLVLPLTCWERTPSLDSARNGAPSGCFLPGSQNRKARSQISARLVAVLSLLELFLCSNPSHMLFLSPLPPYSHSLILLYLPACLPFSYRNVYHHAKSRHHQGADSK